MRLEVWGNNGTELRYSPEKRDGVEFLANGRTVQDLLIELHEEEDANRRKSLNKELNKLKKETGIKGLEELAYNPEYVNMQMQRSHIRITGLIILQC